MRDAFFSELLIQAKNDPEIILITGDLGFGVLDEFRNTLPHQFINAGVAEQNMAALSAGLALSGKKVFTYSIGNFPTLRCLEQIRNDICYHKLDVTTVAIGAGFSYGQLGTSHFATEDLAIMSALPNMSIIVPANSDETACLLRESIASKGPKYLRLDKSETRKHPSLINTTLGAPNILCSGEDFTLIGQGGIVEELLIAARELKKFNLSCDVISLNTNKNIEVDILTQSISKTRKVIILEEHQIRGGLGSSIGDIVLENNIKLELFYKFGLNDEFPEIVGDQSFLRQYYKLNARSVVDFVRNM